MAVLLLVGCNALRLGYNNGESVTYWWLNSYVDFEREQEPWVKKHIAEFFEWHRKDQLKEYAQLLTHSRKRLQQTVTPADMLSDYGALKRQIMLSIDYALPRLADLALSLQPHQIERIEKKFASNNESYRKEYLRGDLEDRQLVRFKKVMKNAEYWFGDFSAEQERQIRAASDARPLDGDLAMKVRLRRQQELIKVLKKIQAEKPSRDVADKMLKAYIDANFERFGSAEEKAFSQASYEGTARMVALIVNMATPAQKERAAERMQQWIEDCQTMTRSTQ